MMAKTNKYENYEPTTYPWGPIIFFMAFIYLAIAFFSPYWLANDGEIEDAAFVNTGLWTVCFKNYGDFKYFYDRVYDGCYWTLAEEMHVRDDHFLSPFFVTVQVFFTFSFTLSLIGFALVTVLVLCPGEEFERWVLKATFIDLFASFFFGFIAVIVFGAMGDNRDWMPHWEHNYLSWSFALAVVGVVHIFIAAVLFWVEYRILKKKDSQGHGVFTLQEKD